MSISLPSRRRFLAGQAEREARNGTVRWHSHFPQATRQRLLGVYQLTEKELSVANAQVKVNSACLKMMRAGGIRSTAANYTINTAFSDSSVPTEDFMDWLEAIPLAFETLTKHVRNPDGRWGLKYLTEEADNFRERVNDILLEERISWVFLHGELHDREDAPLVATVLMPTEAKLSSSKQFTEVENLYNQALKAMGEGNYPHAVSLTYSALQETFHALGVEGNDLRQLMGVAKRDGFLASVDDKLVGVINSLNGWFTGNRSARGDAHGAAKVSEAEREDAEMSINIVSSFILRLIRIAEK